MSKLNIQPAITYGAVVGHILQQQRKLLGIDQGQVATSMGMSRSAYSRVETGQTSITLAQLRKAATVIGKTPSWILQLADDLESRLSQQKVNVIPERDAKEVSPAAALIALGLLLALLAQLAD